MINEENENLITVDEETRMGCHGLLMLIVLVIVVVSIIYFAFESLNDSDDSSNPPATTAKADQSSMQSLPKTSVNDDRLITLTPEQWTEHMNALNDHRQALNEQRNLTNDLYSDLMTLRNEVRQLQKQVRDLGAKPVTTTQPKPKAEAAPKKPSKTNHTSTGFRPDAVVFAGYQHDYMSPYARFSVRNTTDKTITSFTFRIQYYNMNGSMIDFEETTYDMILKPGKAYTINIPGYKYESNYVYRSSANAHEGIPYQVDFELLSIVVKN